MLFGVRNEAQTFQRFISEVLQGLEFIFAYIDDLLNVCSKSMDEHKEHLRLVFSGISGTWLKHQCLEVFLWNGLSWVSWLPQRREDEQ